MGGTPRLDRGTGWEYSDRPADGWFLRWSGCSVSALPPGLAVAAAKSFYGLSLVTETGEAIKDMIRRKATWGYLL